MLNNNKVILWVRIVIKTQLVIMVFLTFCIILSAVDLLVFDKYATANDFARIKADKMCLDNANTEVNILLCLCVNYR